MNNNNKKTIILIVVIVAVFVLAAIGYNSFKSEAPVASYVPTINQDKVTKIENETKDTSQTSAVAVQTPTVGGSTDVKSDDDQAADDLDAVTADESSASDGDESASEEEQQSSSVFPDIPIILYGSNAESTFWTEIPLGKPVVINLFASWCPPCQKEMPDFVELRDEYKDQVTFAFFDSFDGTRENDSTIKEYVEKTFTDEDTLIILDKLGYISYLFNTNSIPITIVLDKNGEVVQGYQGSINRETLENQLKSML
jgi:thiol-disulfide isomerase/thioredoxin